MSRMNIEIFSDIVCPWCYIGKRRFEAALAQFEHRDQVDVTWRSYQLDPSAPREFKGTATERLAQKMGSLERAQAAQQRVTDLAAGEGLSYRMDIAKHGNTFDAHRLIHLAAHHGLQDEAKERLLSAYFTEGVAIGEPGALVKLAEEIGLDSAEARAVIEGDGYRAEVEADIQRALDYGISGVPFFAADQKYGLSGAQPTEVMLEFLNHSWQQSNPLVMVGAGNGEVCEGDECAV